MADRKILYIGLANTIAAELYLKFGETEMCRQTPLMWFQIICTMYVFEYIFARKAKE